MSAASLQKVFDGHEPLEQRELESSFGALLGLSVDAKPFECVGDIDECRAALALAADRDDRKDNQLLNALLEKLGPEHVASPVQAASLLKPAGPHYIPDRYAPPDLLVRTH
jgi:hypothetical protein